MSTPAGCRERSPCCSSFARWPPLQRPASRRAALENCETAALREMGVSAGACNPLCRPGCLAKGLGHEQEAAAAK